MTTLDEHMAQIETLSKRAAADDSEEALDAFVEFEELATATVEELIAEVRRLRLALVYQGKAPGEAVVPVHDGRHGHQCLVCFPVTA